MEALYQSVWAQVFALEWERCRASLHSLQASADIAQKEADAAAEAALVKWSHNKAHAAVTAKGQES